jgi:hypothetical protein
VYGQGQGQSYTAPGTQHPQWNNMAGGQYVDSAIGIIGKYAGQDTKKKVEQGLEGVFKSESCLVSSSRIGVFLRNLAL